ncbi:MAG: DUF4040 domain-containing protein [Limnospira sp.]
MNDSYIYVITALMPLAAGMVVFQVNPYHALVLRGILGAVAALVYAIMGAADVALTEALVGTMLAIMLYAVAVRSSLVMRLGILKDELAQGDRDDPFEQLMEEFRTVFRQHYMRLELIPFKDIEALDRALVEKEVHGTCVGKLQSPSASADVKNPSYQTTVRLRRLYDIMKAEVPGNATILTYINPADSKDKH